MKEKNPGTESKATPFFDQNGTGNQVKTDKIKHLVDPDIGVLEHIKGTTP